MDAFAQIDYQAILRISDLTLLEYQLFTVFKMEEFLGGGICKLAVKEIQVKYRFKNYDSLTHASKGLRTRNWIVKVRGGYVCQTDFSKILPLENGEKLRNSKFSTKKTGRNGPKPAEKLKKTKSKTENFQVSNLENPSFPDADKEEILNIQEQVFEPSVSHTSFAGGGKGVSADQPEEPLLPPQSRIPDKKAKPRRRDVDFERLAAVCFLKRTALERQTLSGKERGMLNQNLKKLRDAGCDLARIGEFEAWWRQNWRSGTRDGNYEPPRPDQVVTYWSVGLNFREIVEEVGSSKGKPVWVKVGSSEIDVSNNYDRQGNYVPQPLDERGRREALEMLVEMREVGTDYRDMRKWYLPEDWQWLEKEMEETI